MGPFRMLEIPDNFAWTREPTSTDALHRLRLCRDPGTGCLRLCSNATEALLCDLKESGLVRIADLDELQYVVDGLHSLVRPTAYPISDSSESAVINAHSVHD